MNSISEASFKQLLDPDRDQVFLFTCPATLPFAFARHPWLVVNRGGIISRWEVLYRSQKWETNWGHLYKNFYSPTQGITKFFFSEKWLWRRVRLEGYAEGDMARHMAEFVETSPRVYPFSKKYSLTGPNSNTYVQWVLGKFSESGLHLPRNSFGKGFVEER